MYGLNEQTQVNLINEGKVHTAKQIEKALKVLQPALAESKSKLAIYRAMPESEFRTMKVERFEGFISKMEAALAKIQPVAA